MNLCLLRTEITQLSSFFNYTRHLHHLRNCRNGLVPGFNNSNIKSRNLLLNVSIVNQFSTGTTLSKSKDKVKEKKKVVHVDLDEIADIVKVERMMSQFDGTIENFKEQMIKHLGLRTRAGAIEEIPVMYEGEEYRIEEIVEISRKPNLIVLNVSAFPQAIPNILESLSKSQMNLNPQQDGTVIHVQLPKVTKEYRTGLMKSAKQYFVRCKDKISDIRNEHIRELKKKENVPTDMVFKAESYINALQKDYVNKADEILKIKEKELLGESK